MAQSEDTPAVALIAAVISLARRDAARGDAWALAWLARWITPLARARGSQGNVQHRASRS